MTSGSDTGEQQADHVTIADAAERLGVTPWDVVRLIEDGRLRATWVIAIDSLDEHARRTNA